MKPKIIHQQAMDFSFKAKQAIGEGDFSVAFKLYKNAAELESQVAEFYLDKPELEPTRSIVIRSAAFLNLKAGLLENALKYILFGLFNIKDELLISQLNNALEFAVSLRNLTPEVASREFNYLNLLRQRSVHYVIEPSSLFYGRLVSLEMIKDFSVDYLKSLKAYAKSQFKRMLKIENEIEEIVAKELDRIINPLVTNSSHGSFKFSITNDFLPRVGEDNNITELKSNVVLNYHNEIFTNPLSDFDIGKIRRSYSDDEVNEIFRPLTKIKSNNTPYKIGYYDTENLNKIFVNRIVNNQRKKLLSINQISQEDIGELESSIIHKRSSQSGKITKKTIFKEQLKSYEFEISTNLIEPKNIAPLLLNEEILINIFFSSDSGFKYTFSDIQIEYSDVEYEKGLTNFYTLFYNRVLHLINTTSKSEQEQKDWEIIRKLIGNPDSLKS